MERDVWRTAVIGKEGFELWEFITDREGLCLESTCSPIVHFSLDIDSPGFQRFVSWLATDFKVGTSVIPAKNMADLPPNTDWQGPCKFCMLCLRRVI